ncbi:MAG TPA: serine hydrolase domain-containing protein [Acidimicrobiales bacterium]|nr:serine hydrolase domain-containing protein [Acidimicrobiales bacterium]
MSAGRLPRSAPSAQDVDAAGILAFLDAVGSAALDLHSLMVLRHGHVVAEGWWAPYRADQICLLYSLSKSFTSTAIGMAEAEGLLSIDDPVVGFFPDKAPQDASSSYVGAMKVRHLLAMASGHAEDTMTALARGGPDMVRTFLSIPPDKEPGSLFCYNQGCTYTLSAIISKLTGKRLVDYLRPRLFGPLGIGQTFWWHTEEGIDQGFSGFHVDTESVAKLGQLYLQEGRWEGRQLVPESYVRQARAKQVDNSQQADNTDWQQGYGFQFWVCRHDAYRGDGAFGQFCVVVPDADAVIACTAQVADMQAQLDLIWEHLLPAVSGHAKPDGRAAEHLAERLQRLSTAVIDAPGGRPGPEVTFIRTTEPAPHTEALGAIRVKPAEDGTRLTVVADGVGYPFDLRRGQWTEGELPGLRAPLPAVAVSGGWPSSDEFQADVVSLTSPHRLQLRARTGEQPTFDATWYLPPL